MTLLEAKKGDLLKITGISDGENKRKLLDFGFNRGMVLRVITFAPLKKTVLVALRGYVLALRAKSCALIEVTI